MDAAVLSFEEAIAVVVAHAVELRPGRVEEVELLASRGRVLAADVTADRDQPPFDRATRDGFAVRTAEWSAGQDLQIVGQVRAGEIWRGPPPPRGAALEIMTGAPVPPDTDAVAMVEHAARSGSTIRAMPGRTLQAGENIVPQGSEARFGGAVIAAGTLLGAAEIALAAACGRATLPVYTRPRVAILATGDELVEFDQAPSQQQIRNSNSYALAALVAAAGGEADRRPIVPDQLEAVDAAIQDVRTGEGCDLLVLSGGVSMGQYDLVEQALAARGAEFFFTGVRMQPGRPVVFGRLPAAGEFPALFFFGLPGNPVSTQVTFHVFVETMIRALAGAPAQAPRFLHALLAETVPARPGLTRLLPAQLTGSQVRLVGWQGSGDLAANARADCYVLLPEGPAPIAAGTLVGVLLR